MRIVSVGISIWLAAAAITAAASAASAATTICSKSIITDKWRQQTLSTNEGSVPPRALLRRPRSIMVTLVDKVKSEAEGIAIGPFKVVHQTPHHVALIRQYSYVIKVLVFIDYNVVDIIQ